MTLKKTEEKLYDLRTLDNYINRGLVKPSEYEKYLKSLPDDEGNFDRSEIEDDGENEETEE